MILFWQMVGADDRFEALVSAEKAEDADQFGVARHRIENGEAPARGVLAYGIRLGLTEKRQRMVRHVPQTIDVFHMGVIATGMNDDRHRLETLRATQPLGDSRRQQVRPPVVRVEGLGLGKVEFENVR